MREKIKVQQLEMRSQQNLFIHKTVNIREIKNFFNFLYLFFCGLVLRSIYSITNKQIMK